MDTSFSPGKTIEEHRIKGRTVVFRYPKKDDTKGLMGYINSLVREKAFILMTKEVSIEEEERYVRSILDRNRKGLGIDIVIEVSGKIVGKAEVHKEKPFQTANDHVAHISIGIGSGYRDMGIGTKALQLLERMAVQKWGTEILRLSCICPNKRARHVYEKLGFRAFGTIPGGFKRDGVYHDEVYMYKSLQNRFRRSKTGGC